MKEERFEKVVEYDEAFRFMMVVSFIVLVNFLTILFQDDVLTGIICIADFSYLCFMSIYFLASFENRKVYWRKIK